MDNLDALKQASEYLQNELQKTQAIIKKTKVDSEFYKTMCKIERLDEIAIKALEKQIPKSTYWENSKNGKIYDFGWFCCPKCNEMVDDFEEWKFCPSCGQALDWGEDDGT